MGKSLAQAYPVALEVFQKADEWLGFRSVSLLGKGPEDELNATINTQPALLVHSIAAAARAPGALSHDTRLHMSPGIHGTS